MKREKTVSNLSLDILATNLCNSPTPYTIQQDNKGRFIKKYKNFKDWCLQNNKTIYLEEWDLSKNKIDIAELDYYYDTTRYFWKCKQCQFVWESTIRNRYREGNNCPKCTNNLLSIDDWCKQNNRLDILSEWDIEKNGINPSIVLANSKTKYHWVCQKCNNTKLVSPYNRRREKIKCVVCRSKEYIPKGILEKNSFASMYPEISKEWHPTKNGMLLPEQMHPYAKKKVFWLCSICKQEHVDTLAHKSAGRGCPICSNKQICVGYNDLATTHPQLVSEWSKNNVNLTPQDVTYGSGKKVWWTCPFGHEYLTAVKERTRKNNGTNCPICVSSKRTSYPEKMIYFYMKQLFPDLVANYKLKKSSELDMYCPSLHFGIEYDGCAYHKNTTRDLKKDIICKQKGLKLLRIRELDCPDLITSSITIKLKSNRLEESIHVTLQEIFKHLNLNCDISTLLHVNIENDKPKILNLVYESAIKNSLAIQKPNVIHLWHPTKNYPLVSTSIGYKSSYKAWWLCSCKESWQQTVSTITSSSCCPNCKEKGILFNTYTELEHSHIYATKLNEEANTHLKKQDAKIYKDTIIGWKCTKGHTWSTPMSTYWRKRVQNCTCPYCTHKKVWQGETDLASNNPELLPYWDYAKNNPILPQNVFPNTQTKYHWKCYYGHTWEISPYVMKNRKYTKCIECKKLGIE